MFNILHSLSPFSCMLALPFITEGTGFKGRIYATEPTMTFGRLFMEETIEYVERSSKGQRASRWKAVCKALPSPLCDAENPQVVGGQLTENMRYQISLTNEIENFLCSLGVQFSVVRNWNRVSQKSHWSATRKKSTSSASCRSLR